VLRNHDHTFIIADDHIARIDRDPAAADRHVHLDRVVLDQVERRAAARAIDREVHLRDRAAVAHWAVGDESCRAAFLQPRRQDLPAGRDARLAAAIEHEHGSGRRTLDRLALRMIRVFECAQLVEVFARRDIAHRERRSDEVAARRSRQPRHALHADVAESALEELRAERRGARLAQALDRFLLEFHGFRPRSQ
jgi:hypothetical protein